MSYIYTWIHLRLFVCKSHLKEAGGQELKYPIAKHHTKAHGGSDSTWKVWYWDYYTWCQGWGSNQTPQTKRVMLDLWPKVLISTYTSPVFYSKYMGHFLCNSYVYLYFCGFCSLIMFILLHILLSYQFTFSMRNVKIIICFIQVTSIDTCHSKYVLKISQNIMEHASTPCHLKSTYMRCRF